MNNDALQFLTPITLTDPAELARRVDALRGNVMEIPLREGWDGFAGLEREFDEAALPVRHALVETPLAWTDEDKRAAAWIHRCSDSFSVIGYRLYERASREWGLQDARTRHLMARTLQLMGDTLKWEVAVTPESSHDLRKPHALMRTAMEAGLSRTEAQLQHDGRVEKCTLEGLYFRLLLLGRFASGALTLRQLEILDAWIWLWMPVLAAVDTPPPGAALRVDLDGNDGLKRGPRTTPGPSLYLPQAPIENAYRAVVAQFHRGRIVPSEGIASRFRIEDYAAVLDIGRRGLRESKRAPVARAERHAREESVELLVGLGEIAARRGVATAPAPAAPALELELEARDDKPSVRRETVLDDIYGARRRFAKLVNESETGFAVEARTAECGGVAAGDLVAIVRKEAAPIIAKVARSAPSRNHGRTLLGLRILGSRVRVVTVTCEAPGRAPEALQLPFVPGEDASGRHDAFLVSERAFGDKATLALVVGASAYSLRFNRVRQRGRGWVLAGFEVISAKPVARVAA